MKEIKCIFNPKRDCTQECGNYKEIIESIQKAAIISDKTSEEVLESVRWDIQEWLMRIIRKDMLVKCLQEKY